MIRTVRPIHLLAALALLLSGLLQPLAAAQEPTCARRHPPADVARQATGTADGVAADPGGAGPGGVVDGHDHSRSSQPQDAVEAPAPCGSVAVPAERSTLPHTPTARHLLPPGGPPPASAFLQSLFRPPRLS